MDTIGVVCEPDHPVFGRVGERLAARGFRVEFHRPGDPLDGPTVAAHDAFAVTVLHRGSVAALRAADRAGVETWNGFVPATALSCRLIALHALERVGCRVPSAGSIDDSRLTRRVRWDDRTGERRTVRQERVDSGPVTHRYYAVDDGVETHVQATALRDSLSDHRPAVEATDADVEVATRLRELLERFDARALGVDVVRADDGPYAVDVDPAPQFHGAGMERRLADSLASLTTVGA